MSSACGAAASRYENRWIRVLVLVILKGAIMAGTFEVYKDKAGKFRFRLKAGNGEVVASGEAYESMSNAKKGCDAVQRAAAGAKIVEVDK